MTSSPIAPPSPDDIVLEDEGLTQRLDREADALLDKAELYGMDKAKTRELRDSFRKMSKQK